MTPEELDERYYVRVRGKVQGPWTLRRLRSLRSRGQLSRAFDVSTDRVNWTPATQIPGLSDPETRAGGITIDPDEVPLDVVPMEESASTPPQTSVEIPDVGAAIRAASLTTFLLIVLVGGALLVFAMLLRDS